MLSRIALRAAAARPLASSITTTLPAILTSTPHYSHNHNSTPSRWTPHRTYAKKPDRRPSNVPPPPPSSQASPSQPQSIPEEPIDVEDVPKFDPRTLLDQGIPPTPSNYDPSSKYSPNRPQPVRPQSSSAHDQSLDPLPRGTSSGSGGDGKKGPQYVSSADRKRERLATFITLSFLLGGVGGVIYLGRNWDTEEELRLHADVPNGWGPMLFYNRITTRLSDILDYYNLPNGEKLLPDHTPDTYRPYTLVISLEDMLVHSEWTRENGWRTAKRPGVDYFLTYLSQYYELVIFTSQQNTMAGPMVAKLDPYRACHQLYREATKYKGGKYIKDLTYLNRDISKVIMIDTKPAAWHDQPDNAIKMKPWKGDPKDKELVALIPFLEYIATMGLDSIPAALKTFPEGSSIPIEFAKREAAAREAFQRQLEEEKSKKKKAGGGDFLANLLGLRPKEVKEEKMIQDQVRERGQQTYEEIAKNLREHGEEYLEMDRKAQEEMMAGMKTSLNRIFTEGMPQPPMPPQQPDPNQKK